MSTIKIVTSCGKVVEVRGESLVLELLKGEESSAESCQTPPPPRPRQIVEEEEEEVEEEVDFAQEVEEEVDFAQEVEEEVEDHHWTKLYNFGDTFMGPVYRGGGEDMDLVEEDDPDGMEIDY